MKLAYDGSKFFGFQIQPEIPTVEGSLIDALEAVGAVRRDLGCGLRSSSRTDRGVSALGNVVSFETDFRLRSLCPALNSELSAVWTYSAAEVGDGFNPRWAKQRWYRYCLPIASQDLSAMRAVARRFVGTHDFSGFARLDGRNPVRTIDSIDITESGPFFIMDFRAESFLWNMVRRIVWLVNAVGNGSLRSDEFSLETGHRPRRTGLAPPEYLLLMDVDCGVDFPHNAKAVRALRREFRRRITELDMKREFSRLALEGLEMDDAQ